MKNLLLLLCPLIAFATITPDNLYENSECWPMRATWTGDASVDVGFPGILIRVEEDGWAVLDYGRDGIHRLRVEDTDLVASANQIQSGDVVKEMPNFLAYSTNMFITYNAPNDEHLFSTEEIASKSHVLLVYCNNETLEATRLVKALRELSESMADQDVQLLFIPTNLSFYGMLPKVGLAPIQVITPHMAAGSLKMFSHDPSLDGPLTAALIDLNGKVLSSWRAKDVSENLSIVQEIELFLNAEINEGKLYKKRPH